MASLGSDEYWRGKALDLTLETRWDWYETDPNDVLALGEELGFDKLAKALDHLHKIEDAYWDHDDDLVDELYDARDEDFPDWFWRYHGVGA